MNDLMGTDGIGTARRLWTIGEIEALFTLPFNDLLFRAQQLHRKHHNPNEVQISTLMSIKTGGCSEDCGYCPQSAHHCVDVEKEQMRELAVVLDQARIAKEQGATRFCMSAAWRSPQQEDMVSVLDMVRAVKAMGLETCVTLGMLKDGQAEQLHEAGLNYYNHNLDTAEEFYREIITTHTYRDRMETLDRVRKAGVKVCSGGIVGMGETRACRAALIAQLANLNPQPESVPINLLVPIQGTPLADVPDIDPFEFARTIACARLTMPSSLVRLSAGRQKMSDELQALCFFAGANSIFYGDKLLVTDNASTSHDQALFKRLGINLR